MQYSENYHMNKPELADQYNLLHWNENTDIVDTQLKANADSISAETTRATNAETALQNITNETLKTALLNFCYPVGSIYWSSNSTNPSELFGGTWTAIKDKFIWAKGDNDTVNGTGGEKTVTLSSSQIPAHQHGMQHYHDKGTMKIYGKIHKLRDGVFGTDDWTGDGALLKVNDYQIDGNLYQVNVHDYNANSRSILLDTSLNNGSGWTGKTSGSLANNTTWDATEKTLTDNNINAGGAHNNMPPYIVKYCWERTA